MKFVYEYRTSDNVPHKGTIAASTKEAAYDALKARGIKPGKVWEAPGLFNKLFGKGKRWIAIVVLLLVSATLAVSLMRTTKQIADVEGKAQTVERAQLFGDPVVIGQAERMGWFNEFKTFGERHLAKHAIPGKECGCKQGGVPHKQLVESMQKVIAAPCAILEDDLAEVVQMKRMVNAMKIEAQEYLKDGGTIEGYLERLCIRQKAEHGVYERVRLQILKSKDESFQNQKNAELRAMGLPMVEIPESEEK